MKRYTVKIETAFSVCEYNVESDAEHRATLTATALFLKSWPMLGKAITTIQTIQQEG